MTQSPLQLNSSATPIRKAAPYGLAELYSQDIMLIILC